METQPAHRHPLMLFKRLVGVSTNKFVPSDKRLKLLYTETFCNMIIS